MPFKVQQEDHVPLLLVFSYSHDLFTTSEWDIPFRALMIRKLDLDMERYEQKLNSIAVENRSFFISKFHFIPSTILISIL